MIYRQNLSETKGIEQGNIRKKSLQKYHLVHFLFVCQLLSMYSWLTVLNITCETALEKTNYSSICECQSQFFSFRAEILCPFPCPNLGILSVLTWFRLCASSLSLCEFICAWIQLCLEDTLSLESYNHSVSYNLLSFKHFTLSVYLYFTISSL